jgi:hypothetical protein
MKLAIFFAILAAGWSRLAVALDATEVFATTSPSVFAVRALDGEERLLRSGSAVAIGRERLVTNCHLLVKAQAVQVRRGNVSYGAALQHADVERDLCTLTVEGLVAPAPAIAPMSEVRVGQRAYAITNPEKLALTLSEGLISGSQTEDPGLPPIQTTIPLAPGASGGGLFDERGRLIGIVTLNVARGNLPSNVNFALPAQWITEVEERGKFALAKRDEERAAKTIAGAVVAGALPTPGSMWSYTMRDRVYPNRDREFSVQLGRVDGWDVTEIVSSQGQQETYGGNAREVAFYQRRVGGESVLELAPYLLSHLPKPQLPLGQTPQGYPSGGLIPPWRLRVTDARPETVVVPAGRYEAIRISVTGENPGAQQPANYGGSGLAGQDFRTARFEFVTWYVPELGRYVQARHRMINRFGNEIGDELIQLIRYELARPASPASSR